MVKKIKSWLNILFLTLILIIPGLVFGATGVYNSAADPTTKLNAAANTYGPYTSPATNTSLASTLGVVISAALSILGIVFIIIIIIAGFQWMTAQGKEEQVKKATDAITRSVIGLVIVISSYAIWVFIKTYFIQKIT